MGLTLQPPHHIKLGEHGGTYEVRATERPCTVCDKEIQPGQLYVPGPLGPRHLGCGLH